MKVSNDPSATRRVVIKVVQTGNRLDSSTTTSNSCGTETTPSVTVTVTRLVLGPWASVGCQFKTPLVLTVRPSGPLTNANFSACTGKSASVALRVKVNWSPSVTRRLTVATHTGGWFCSRTRIRNSWVADAIPSLAKTRTQLVLGPWASVGCQVRTPLVLTVSPTGPSTNP